MSPDVVAYITHMTDVLSEAGTAYPSREHMSLYLQLFVGGFMSYLRYLCLFVDRDVQHILCCAFAFFSSSCVPYVASFSGLSIFD